MGSESEGLKCSFRIPSSPRETELGFRREKKRRNSRNRKERKGVIKRQKGGGGSGGIGRVMERGEGSREAASTRPPSEHRLSFNFKVEGQP